jgi:phytoene dehydrogenase-like protein
MKQRSIIIIGAGIAGLAAGCYGQMNGYRTHIFELHDLPGGLCTAWERKGYTFDGCLHYLYGSGPGQPFHQMWQELGAVQDRPMVHHAEFLRIVGGDGQTLIVYCDPDQLESHLVELSPADRPLITRLANGVRGLLRFNMALLDEKPRSLMRPDEWLAVGRQMLPFTAPLLRWGFVSAQDVAARFKSPFLRRAVPLMFNWPEIPMLAGLAQLAAMHTGNAGFPIGGSLAFARAIERRYHELGGEISYKSQVEKILVENDRAVGVRLYNDEEHRADHIVSAADGHATIFEMLAGRYANKRLRALYDEHLPTYSLVQVSLGVNRNMSAEPHWTTYLLDAPLLIAGAERRELGLKHYSFDPTLAPPGKAVLEVMLPADYDYWQRIYGRLLYKEEQTEVSDEVIAALSPYYPDLADQIEEIDVATPLSYERYTGNWRGSTCGWLLTKETMPLLLRGVPKTLPGLDGCSMAGQWVEPGGSVSLAALAARNVVQLICHRDGRPFVAEVGGGQTVMVATV